MGMMYVPAELVREVELLKEFRRKEKCYDIICYDSKEERENEERTFPHTPFKKGEKKKEEIGNANAKKEKNYKKEFSLFPAFEEVKAYYEELNVKEFDVKDFYDYYESYGWVSKDGNRIHNWRALLRGWQRKAKRQQQTNDNKQSKLNNNEQIKKTTHTGAHAGQDRDARAREMEEWLDAHYPVSPKAATTNPGAAAKDDESMGSDPNDSTGKDSVNCESMGPDPNDSLSEAFCKAYGVECVGLYRSVEAVERLRGKAQKLAQVARRIGTAPVIRLVILHLDALAQEVNTSSIALSPEKLASMATTLLQEYHYLTMPELMLAMNRLRSGAYGDFCGRLTTPRLMGAMRRFKASPPALPQRGGGCLAGSDRPKELLPTGKM